MAGCTLIIKDHCLACNCTGTSFPELAKIPCFDRHIGKHALAREDDLHISWMFAWEHEGVQAAGYQA